MKITVSIWPSGRGIFSPDEPIGMMELVMLRAAWQAWQENDPLALLIEETETVQASRLVFIWDGKTLELEPEWKV